MIMTIYHSPLGDISLAATARGLAGLWFRGVDCAPSICTDSARFDMNGGGLIDPDSAATVEEIDGALGRPEHVRVESGARLRDSRVGTLLGVAQRLFRRSGSTMGSPDGFRRR